MKQPLLRKVLFFIENKGLSKKTFWNEINIRHFFCLKLIFLFLLFSSNAQGQISVNPSSFCSGTSPSVAISIRVNGGVSPYTVSYKIGTAAPITKTNYISTTPITVPIPVANTIYTVTSIVDKTGVTVPITGTGNVTISVLPRPSVPIITAEGPTALCQGGSVTLTSSAGTTYRWTTPQGILTTQSITASTAGNYSVQVTNASGCSSITSVVKTIEIIPFPTAPIVETVNQPTCLLNTGSIILSGLPADGNWTINPGAITGTGTTVTLPDLNPGNYQFSVVNESGCQSDLSDLATIQPVPLAPAAPVLNTVINSCQSSFNQTWEAVENASGYQLDVSTSSDFSSFLTGYENKTLGNVTSEMITGIIPGVSYFVRLRTISDCGVSLNSQTKSVDPITTTYSNGTWSNGLPNATKSIVFESDFNVDSNLNGCSCTVMPGVAVTVNSGFTLKLENGLNVQGAMTFENNASLVQVNDAVNTGNIIYKRKTFINRFDLTYWSSPINRAGGFTMHDLSPNTLYDKYFSYVLGTGWTTNLYGTLNMNPGEGYSIRGPQNFNSTIRADFTGEFIGVPNNGNISVNALANKYILVGNPYPSSINVREFYRENPTLKALYFWTHSTPPTYDPADNKYKYSQSDYVVLNLTGTVKTYLGQDLPPFETISSAQSFMTNVGETSIVNFTNSMRVAGENSHFYKTNTNATVENRLWLNLTNTQGAFKQLLIGYLEGATNNIDSNYDGLTVNSNSTIDFYSLNGTSKLTIQGRALPFEENDIVPLGYKSTIAGTFTISIDMGEGVFQNQSVFLEDKTTNTFHNLTCGNYTFDTAIGTFTDRFVIHYHNNDNRPALLSPVAANSILNCTETSYVQGWSAVQDAKKYKIDVATDVNFTTFLAGYQDKELENVTSETVTGIIPGTKYYVRVRAVNDCGTSLNSNVVTPQLISTTYENGSWTNGFPDSSKEIIFNTDYNLSTDMNGCSCQVNSGASVVVNSGITLKLQNGLHVQGNLTFENDASLVQINEATNTGNIVYKRYSSPMVNFDWTMWSSPVSGFTMYQLSPNTLADKYTYFDPNTNGWITSYNGVAVMQPGIGYQIRTPKEGLWPNGELVVFPYSQLVKFTGVPNNGTIIGANFSPQQLHLVGNPYPSALDIEAFIEANSGLYGTIRIQNHNTPVTNGSYSSNDFSKYSFLGGIAGAEPGQGDTSSKPTGKIAAGQSFFINTWGTGTFTFNNSMRVLGQNSQFFRPGKTSKTASVEKHRIWLNLTNTSGGFRQILIGYTTATTNDYDSKYDSTTSSSTAFIRFYSIVNTSKYDIQGRAMPFDNTDIVPLGYSAIVSGTYTIAIDEVDGLFINQDIYLEDKTTNTYHNLKDGSYSFTTAVGTFNDRFVIHYINTGSSGSTGKKNNIEENKSDANDPLVFIEGHQIKIYAFAEKIKQIDIFDTKGSLIYTKSDLNSSNFGVDKSLLKKQVLIVKTTLQNGQISNTKIIL